MQVRYPDSIAFHKVRIIQNKQDFNCGQNGVYHKCPIYISHDPAAWYLVIEVP